MTLKEYLEIKRFDPNESKELQVLYNTLYECIASYKPEQQDAIQALLLNYIKQLQKPSKNQNRSA